MAWGAASNRLRAVGRKEELAFAVLALQRHDPVSAGSAHRFRLKQRDGRSTTCVQHVHEPLGFGAVRKHRAPALAAAFPRLQIRHWPRAAVRRRRSGGKGSRTQRTELQRHSGTRRALKALHHPGQLPHELHALGPDAAVALVRAGAHHVQLPPILRQLQPHLQPVPHDDGAASPQQLPRSVLAAQPPLQLGEEADGQHQLGCQAPQPPPQPDAARCMRRPRCSCRHLGLKQPREDEAVFGIVRHGHAQLEVLEHHEHRVELDATGLPGLRRLERRSNVSAPKHSAGQHLGPIEHRLRRRKDAADELGSKPLRIDDGGLRQLGMVLEEEHFAGAVQVCKYGRCHAVGERRHLEIVAEVLKQVARRHDPRRLSHHHECFGKLGTESGHGGHRLEHITSEHPQSLAQRVHLEPSRAAAVQNGEARADRETRSKELVGLSEQCVADVGDPPFGSRVATHLYVWMRLVPRTTGKNHPSFATAFGRDQPKPVQHI